jgi:hypothetical protein
MPEVWKIYGNYIITCYTLTEKAIGEKDLALKEQKLIAEPERLM